MGITANADSMVVFWVGGYIMGRQIKNGKVILCLNAGVLLSEI